MSRFASLVLLPIFAVAVVVVLFSSLTATRTARARNAVDASRSEAAPVAPTRPAALDAASGKATVTATDFKFSASEIHAPAGKIELMLHNAGKVEHELVLLKTSASPTSLKVAASGRVSEAATVGEVSEIKPGVSKSTTFNLKPGRYVYVCNIPGHYASGMSGVLVVK
jgi:uncharacterized cupredoxin-like copper-binding protein